MSNATTHRMIVNDQSELTEMSTMLLKLLEFNFSRAIRNSHVKLLDEIMHFLLSEIDPSGMKVLSIY